MYIGKKNGNIVAFNASQEDLAINASIKGITLDSIEETEEPIVPYYNTVHDGIYYKQSEVPSVPPDIANEATRNRRRELYEKMSDPITNNISVLQDMIVREDYSTEDELQAIGEEISALYLERKSIREQIVADNPFVE
ncbi:MAG: hypothetical protein LBS22_01530 [Puniceicoccales bacterium]|jgi:hypothetical protein|nr:hypothetical protein [Puniceicoccales bacterium]